MAAVQVIAAAVDHSALAPTTGALALVFEIVRAVAPEANISAVPTSGLDAIPGYDLAIATAHADIDVDNNWRLARVEGGEGEFRRMGTLVMMFMFIITSAVFAKGDIRCSLCSRFANNDNWLGNRPLRHDCSGGAFLVCSFCKIRGQVSLKTCGPQHNRLGVQWEYRREGNPGSRRICPIHSNSDGGWDWEATVWLLRFVDVDFSRAIRAFRSTR